jgi:hypothetical protein
MQGECETLHGTASLTNLPLTVSLSNVNIARDYMSSYILHLFGIMDPGKVYKRRPLDTFIPISLLYTSPHHFPSTLIQTPVNKQQESIPHDGQKPLVPPHHPAPCSAINRLFIPCSQHPREARSKHGIRMCCQISWTNTQRLLATTELCTLCRRPTGPRVDQVG